MRPSNLAGILLAALLGSLCVWLLPEKGGRYRGTSASHWERECRQWEPGFFHWSNKSGQRTWWVRKRPLGGSSRDLTGLDRDRMPLLDGDPAALGVLAELLASPDARVRWLAAEGLERLGERGRPAIPALRRALDDEDETVRRAVEQALYRIDREAAERVGLEWTRMGLMGCER